MQVTDRNEKVMPINSNSDIVDAIAELTRKKEMQEEEMKYIIGDIKDSLRPKNLAKAAFHKLTDTEDALSLGLKVGGTIAAGIIAKKVYNKYQDYKGDQQPTSPVAVEEHDSTTMLGSIARTAITSAAINSLPTIKAYLTAAFQNLFVDKETKIIHFKKLDDGKEY